jgi:hypothetical protein
MCVCVCVYVCMHVPQSLQNLSCHIVIQKTGQWPVSSIVLLHTRSHQHWLLPRYMSRTVRSESCYCRLIKRNSSDASSFSHNNVYCFDNIGPGDHLVTGIVGSNPARGMDVCFCVYVWCCTV